MFLGFLAGRTIIMDYGNEGTARKEANKNGWMNGLGDYPDVFFSSSLVSDLSASEGWFQEVMEKTGKEERLHDGCIHTYSTYTHTYIHKYIV